MIFAGVVLLAVFVVVFLVGISWYRKRQTIKRIRQGDGVFQTWTYSPQDWTIMANEFPKFAIPDTSGKVSFTKEFIYLTNYKKEALLEITREMKTYGDGTYLTEIRRLDIPPTEFLCFRVRSKQVIRDNKGRDTGREKCKVEDFRISVPGQHRLETEKVFNFYQEIIDKNADAVANVMPSSSGLGLFGG
jgi:hypothetical protein